MRCGELACYLENDRIDKYCAKPQIRNQEIESVKKRWALLYLYTYLLSWAISAVDIENLLRNNIICLVVCRINTIFAV